MNLVKVSEINQIFLEVNENWAAETLFDVFNVWNNIPVQFKMSAPTPVFKANYTIIHLQALLTNT